MPHFFTLVFILTLLAGHAAQAGAIGFKETEVPDAAGHRQLHVSLWYPTDDQRAPTIIGENRAFAGLSVFRDAGPEPGSHPLVLLSHGFGGSWQNLNWLAGELVRYGYVVAAPDHPGTTTFDKRPEEATRLWQRPRDLSRVLDALLADPKLAGGIVSDRIAAIGHSLGGWTVVELAGGRFAADRAIQDCQRQLGSVTCKLFVELGIGRDASSTSELGRDLSDARIHAVVSLDLGLARGFTPESLVAIHLPVLVIAAGADFDKAAAATAGVAATKTDSAYLADHLPLNTSSYVKIPGAFHFSFMQVCKAGAAEMIEKETPGDGIVCQDGGGWSRSAIHQQVSDLIISFLAKAMPQQ